MGGLPRALHDSRFLLVLIFLMYAAFRFFLPTPYTLITGDIARYLSLAQSFPHHLLYNNVLYAGHPPLYPYLTHVLGTVFADYIAARMVSFFLALVFFITLVKLFRLLGKGRYWILCAMALLSLNFYHIYLSNLGMKESAIIAFTFLAVYYYLKGLKHSPKYFIHSAIFSSLFLFTADLAIFLFPVFALMYIIYRDPETRLRHAIIPALVLLLSFSFWLLLKFSAYQQHAYYPDILGMLAPTEGVGFMQVFNPAYFSATADLAHVGVIRDPVVFAQHAFYIVRSLVNLAYPFNLIGLDNVVLYHKVPYLFPLYAAITICMLAALGSAGIRFARTMRIRGNVDLFFLGITAIFFIPVIDAGLTPRHQIQLIVPFAYFTVEGLFILCRRLRLLPLLRRAVPAAIILSFIILIPLWVRANPYPLITSVPLVPGAEAAAFLSTLPGEGVLDWGEVTGIAYLTDKRVVSLPQQKDDLDFQVSYLNISYISFLEDPYYRSDKTITYIRLHPEKYRLINAIDISYPDDALVIGERQNRYYVYQVIR